MAGSNCVLCRSLWNRLPRPRPLWSSAARSVLFFNWIGQKQKLFLGEIALIHGATGATGLAAVQVKAPWEDVKRGRKSQMPDGEMTDSRENIQNSYVQLLMLVVMISILEPKWQSKLVKQLCSALGVDVIATGGSEEKLEVVKQQVLGKGRSAFTQGVQMTPWIQNR